MDQFLFYQHNVQQYFLRHKKDYAGIIVPLSIAVSFLDGTNGFLRALFTADKTKQFFFDPRSALFQYNWARKNVRPPHTKMAAVLGPLFVSALEKQLTTDMISDDLLKESTSSCIKFQQEFSSHEPKQQAKLVKYAKLAELDVNALPQITNPQHLTPPYFHFDKRGDAWYEASLKCAKFACEEFGAANIQPVIHNCKVLPETEWKAIGEDYKKLEVKQVVYYHNNFKEHEADEDELVASTNAIKALVTAGLAVMRLHGGYFAIAQEKVGLRAFGNGVGYGEWRHSSYHKGGTAEKRIYVPRLHRFLEPTEAQTLVTKNAAFFTENSTLLTHLVANNIGFDNITTEQALEHFMECRRNEIGFVSKSTVTQIRAELDETVAVIDHLGLIEQGYQKSLRLWSKSMGNW